MGESRVRNVLCHPHVGIFWRYLALKFALPPTPNLKFALPPTPTPSQWNIGGVGSSGIGHIYFMYISCSLYFMLFGHHFPRWLCDN